MIFSFSVVHVGLFKYKMTLFLCAWKVAACRFFVPIFCRSFYSYMDSSLPPLILFFSFPLLHSSPLIPFSLPISFPDFFAYSFYLVLFSSFLTGLCCFPPFLHSLPLSSFSLLSLSLTCLLTISLSSSLHSSYSSGDPSETLLGVCEATN